MRTYPSRTIVHPSFAFSPSKVFHFFTTREYYKPRNPRRNPADPTRSRFRQPWRRARTRHLAARARDAQGQTRSRVSLSERFSYPPTAWH